VGGRIGQGGQGTGLEQDERPFRGQRPLHVLGAAEMAFQGQPPRGQLAGLIVGKAGFPAPCFGHGFLTKPAALGRDEHFRLVRDGPPGERQVVPGQEIGVRGDDPVHGVGPEAPDRVDKHFVAFGFLGQPGVEHAGGRGGNKRQTGGGHGDVVVGNALEQAVGHGPWGVETRDDEFVGAVQSIRGHAEHGEVLAGEGEFPVLADGAGAHGEAQARRGDASDGLADGPGHGLGQGGAQDGGLDVLGGLGHAGRIVRGDAQADAADGVHQTGRFEKSAKGGRGHGKSRRHGKPRPIGHLAQVGAFAAHLIHHFAGNLGQGQHERPPVRIDPAVEDRLDGVGN